MRLLWLIDSLNVGGAERLVIPFAAHTRDELFVAAMSSSGENLVEQELRRRGVNVLNLGARNLRDRDAFRRLADFVREQRVDLVHAHLTYSAIWAALLSRRTGVPSVASLHVSPWATRALESSALGRFKITVKDRLLRFVLNRWSSAAILVSAGLAATYRGLKRPRVVHNGIEVDRFLRNRAETRAQLEREFDIPAGAKLAVTVSVLRAAKGVEVLLEAVERVPGVYFLIVGDGPKRAEWQALALSNGTAERVRWAGYRSDVETILAGCDLFVHPSLDDAFPTVLLEAMAAGLPVVASRVGGIPEIVEDGVTGILFPPGDAAALANAIANDALPNMSGAARERAARLFSTEAWIGRLDAVYREAVAS